MPRLSAIAVAVLALVASLILSTPPLAAMVANTTLGHLAGGSELILVGRVVRVVEVPTREPKRGEGPVPGVEVAEVEVLDWIKGSPGWERIWYLAEGTWTCDETTAVEGERALLFLRELGEMTDSMSGVHERLATPHFRKRLKELTGGSPLLRISWSGHGRMPIEEVAGVECAEIDVEVIHPPTDMPTVPGTDPRYTYFVRLAPLDRILRHVRRVLTPVEPPEDGKAARVHEVLRGIAASMDIEGSEEVRDSIDELDESAVAPLFAVLEDPAHPWREFAAEAMAWIGDPGVNALVESLGAKSAARRRGAAFAIEWTANNRLLGPDDVLPSLLKAASHPDPEVRERVVGAMGGWEEDEALAAVVRALTDESLLVRRSAARALVRLQWMLLYGEDLPLAAAERGLLPLTGHEDAAVRREAWEALAWVAGPASLRAALHALEDSDRVVRVTASVPLGRTRSPEAAKRLVQLLESQDPWARRAAAHSLGLGKVADGVGALAKALGDPDERVVGIAIEALGEIGPAAAAAVPALERLRKTTESPATRFDVEAALESIRKE